MESPGKWKVSIFTSEMPSAGTTSQVYITFYGLRRTSGPIFLYSGETDLFQSGHEDIFVINIGDLGEMYKIRIGHNNSGASPSWHCEEVQLSDIFSNEQFCIKVNRWLTQEEDDGEICRELPIIRHGHAKLPVTKYEVRVVTGDLWNAGTEANVYMLMHGERGDTGSRQLLRSSKPRKCVKGQTDTFLLEAVHLGNLHTIVIGHDGLEPGNGWYLEKVVVHDPVQDKEYTFFCYRWLDEGQDDGKIVRQLYISDDADFPAKQELELKKEEIWSAERWKYQKGNTLQFYCRKTRKFIRLTPDCKVDALGEKKDKYGFFDVTVKRGNVRVFNSHQIRNLALAIDKGLVTGMDNSGILCELQIHLQLNRCVTLECIREPGLTVSFDSDGKPADDNTTGYAGLCKEFVAHVKGVFHNGAIILLTTSWSQALCLRPDGHCSGTGNHTEESYWRVHKISSAVCMFQSVTNPRMYLRINGGQCDGEGTGDEHCHFKVEKDFEHGAVSLESDRSRGIYIGLMPDGFAKPMVHTGEKNIMFYPKVIKFGREKPMGTSATTSQIKEVIREQEEVKSQGPVAQRPSVSPPSSKIETTKLRSLEDTLPSLNEWKVSVVTASTGTFANVTLWVYGDKGATGPIILGKERKEQLFLPRQEDEFQVEIPNVGKIYKIRIGHDGTSDQPEWKLQRIILQKMKNGETFYFEANRWLSRSRGDCDIVCELPVVQNGNAVYPVVKYQVNVYTGYLEQAGTQAPVYICIHGERGDSGKRLLLKSDLPIKFQQGQVDMFEIEAVSLGELGRVLLCCDANRKSQYWYCEKVIIREQGKDSEYIFNCERWLPFMSQGIQHTEIELQVQGMQIFPKTEEQKEENEGDWKITVVTGNFHKAGTDATVFLYVYGERTDSGAIILGSGKHQLFNVNSADTFQINVKHLGQPYKLRIGHDNTGEEPDWYLEEVRLQNISSDEEFYLPVNRWLGEERDDGDTWRELSLSTDGKDRLALLDYEIYVYTGSNSNAGPESNVYINLFGTKGDSGKRKLHKTKNQKVDFQKGQVDIFCVQAVSLGTLRKIQISHDGTKPGSGWFLDKIIIQYTEDGNGQEVVFLCNRWLDEYQEDGKTEMELFVSEIENKEKTDVKEKEYPEKKNIKGKKWNIHVKTAKDSTQIEQLEVTLVIYGSKGKTSDILLLPQNQTAVSFLPGAKDEFVADTEDVGEVYKIRIACNNVPIFNGWHLKSFHMEEMQTKQDLKFDCNCWLSLETEEEEIIKEFPVVNNGQEPLPVCKYIVAVHIGDHWGAETSANVYVTLYGERGDSGARKLQTSLVPGERFTRNKTDSFVLEAVSLGQLKKVVLGHDCEGYGAGMYLKMVTVQETQNSVSEWVFPYWNWLDSHIGTCQTVCKLHTIGRRLSTSPKLNAHSAGLWIMDIVGSEFDSSVSPAQFFMVFYGNKGKEKLTIKMSGNTTQIKKELKDLDCIYKLQVSWSKIQLKKPWHFSSMHMKHTGTNQEMWLNFNCWMKPNEENCVDLPAIYPDKDPLPVTEYTIYVQTGDKKNAGSTGKVYLCIEGENGDTGKRGLNSQDTDLLSFTVGQVDNFKIKAVHLGKLRRIVVGFSNSKKDPWFLEKITVKEGDFACTNHVFIYNDWITSNSKTVFTETIILVQDVNVTFDAVKTFSPATNGKWHMQVQCTPSPDEKRGISVVVFGRNGKSLPQKIKNLNYQPFLLDVGDIGEIIKMSFITVGLSFERSIQLHKIRLRDVDTKQEIHFYPEDLLLSDQDVSESVTEVAAVLPDKAPLSEVSYSVNIRTGSFPASGTDADVFITICGENGDSCKRKLKHASFLRIFETGQVNAFSIKAVDLGMLTKVHIEHNAVGFGAGWYLDQITIQGSDKRDIEYLFPCQQWIDTGVSGKKTTCELKLLGKIRQKNEKLLTSPEGTVDVIVVTADVPNGGTNSDVSLTICCEKGNYAPVVFARGSLKQGDTFQTTVDLNGKLGAIRKIRLQMEDNINGENWYCKEVKLQNKQTKETLEFPFLRNFVSGGKKSAAELPVLAPGGVILTVKTYAVYVYITTGQSSELITNTNVFITLQGTLGDTGRRKLSKGEDLSIKGQAAVFQLESVDIGVIQKLFLDKEKQTNLELEKVVVEEGTFIKKKYTFIAQRWKKGEKDKKMFMTLEVTEIEEGSSATALLNGDQPMTSDGEWKVYLTTFSEEKEQITESLKNNSNLVIVFYGNKGKSNPVIIESKEGIQDKDMLIYKIRLSYDLGELFKVRLGLDTWRENRGRLSLYHVKIQNTKTLDTFSHSINKTLPLLFNGDRWIEIPVEWPLKASFSVVTYHVTLFSTEVFNKKDGFCLSVCLHGKNGDTGDRQLTWQNAQEQNGEESFTAMLDAVELGELHHTEISISGKHDFQLNIRKIHVAESLRKDVYIFEVNRAFSIGANEPEIRREVLLSQVIREEHVESNHGKSFKPGQKESVEEDLVEYVVKIYTGDVRGAGTDANVHLVLFGDRDSFGPVQLTQPLEHQNPFERGKVDTFKVTTKSLGRIFQIEIGHDGKRPGSGWFLEKIEILNVSTNQNTFFSCNRWLAEDENDGSTVIQLYS
ncbi:oxygen-regulated protein 1 isoform X2 [Ascaphus truei]